MMKKYYVYIVECSDNSYYTGVTNDYETRISQHNAGIDTNSYTFKRRPVELVYISEFTEVLQAIAWEKKVKRWSRKKKEALILRKYHALPGLSARKTSYKRKCHPEEPQCTLRDESLLRSDSPQGDTLGRLEG